MKAKVLVGIVAVFVSSIVRAQPVDLPKASPAALRVLFGSGVPTTLLSPSGYYVRVRASANGKADGSCWKDSTSVLCNAGAYTARSSRGRWTLNATEQVCLTWQHARWSGMEGCFTVYDAGDGNFLLVAKRRHVLALALGDQTPPRLWEVDEDEPAPVKVREVAVASSRWTELATKLAMAEDCDKAAKPALAWMARGYEVYSVTCVDDDPMVLRCENGSCRQLP